MPTNVSVLSLFDRFVSEEAQLKGRLAELDAEREIVVRALKYFAELRDVTQALMASPASAGSAAPVSRAAALDARGESRPGRRQIAPAAAPTPVPVPAPAPASDDAEGDASGDGRRGRRKISPDTATVSQMGIVKAAIYLARQRGVTEATAGDILGWFRDVGFRTADDLPNRNSVYVSLNREADLGKKRGKAVIERIDRGLFRFHFDQAR